MDMNTGFQPSGTEQTADLLFDLGDVAELTLGEDGEGSEDKRREYA
jgi:hypothetical protein